jgi:hypothetical protein
VKAWKLLLPVPVIAALAMVPQEPQAKAADATEADQSAVMSMSELRYINLQGAAESVPARNVVEIRLLEDHAQHIRLELLYENGDYSMVDAQAFHLIRAGTSSREVRLVRSKQSRLRFPRLP